MKQGKMRINYKYKKRLPNIPHVSIEILDSFGQKTHKLFSANELLAKVVDEMIRVENERKGFGD